MTVIHAPRKGSPWAQGADSPYQGEMARRTKGGRDAGTKGLREFERCKLRSTLNLATDPLRHLLTQMPPALIIRGMTRAGLGASDFCLFPA